jgi:hypothetical protein
MLTYGQYRGTHKDIHRDMYPIGLTNGVSGHPYGAKDFKMPNKYERHSSNFILLRLQFDIVMILELTHIVTHCLQNGKGASSRHAFSKEQKL